MEDLVSKVLTEQPEDPMLAIGLAIVQPSQKCPGAIEMAPATSFVTLLSIEISSESMLQVYLDIRGIPFTPPPVHVPQADYSAAIQAFKNIDLGVAATLKQAARDSPNCSAVHDAVLTIVLKSLQCSDQSFLSDIRPFLKDPAKAVTVGFPVLHVPGTEMRLFLCSQEFAINKTPFESQPVEKDAVESAIAEASAKLLPGQSLLLSPGDLEISFKNLEISKSVTANSLSCLELINAVEDGAKLFFDFQKFPEISYEKFRKFQDTISCSGATVLVIGTAPAGLLFPGPEELVIPAQEKLVIPGQEDLIIPDPEEEDELTGVELRHFEKKLREVGYPMVSDERHVSDVFGELSREGRLDKKLLRLHLTTPAVSKHGSIFQSTILGIFRFNSKRVLNHFN